MGALFISDDTSPSNVEPSTYWCDGCKSFAVGVCPHYEEAKAAADEPLDVVILHMRG